MCGHCVCGRHFVVVCVRVSFFFLRGSLRERNRLAERIGRYVAVEKGGLFFQCEILSYVQLCKTVLLVCL